MNLWMAAILLGIVFGGVFTLAEIIVGTCLLHKQLGGMILLIPLNAQKGEQRLRNAVSWLEWQRGVFPGVVAAADMGLSKGEQEKCRAYCKGSGVIWLDQNELGQAESFIAKLASFDYTE